MKQTITILVTLLIVFASQILHAEVQPVNITLHDGDMTYSVPTGKVLIIEHFIWALESGYTSQTVTITPANQPAGMGNISLSFPNGTSYWTPLRPIKIVGGSGATVGIYQNSIVDWRDVMIVGLLVDYEDLYAAAIDSSMDPIMLVGSDLNFDIALASPRPAVVRTQRASEVDGPYQATTNRPTKTLSSGIWQLDESLEGLGGKGFFRSMARARQTE